MSSTHIKNFLIYGAYGYTGELITRLAVEKGYRPLLGGRDEKRLHALADEMKLPYVVFDLTEEERMNTALQQVGTVLHCAGPFSKTAKLMVFACLRNKVHYLDITGELDVFKWIASKDSEAKKAGITLLPGVGFDVVPTDCLAAYLHGVLPDAHKLELAIAGLSNISRGTALTMVENMHRGGTIRKDGILKDVPAAYRTRKISFPFGERTSVTIPWGDVFTAYYSTRIPNIMVYAATGGPSATLLKTTRYLSWLYKTSAVKQFLTRQVNHRITGPGQQRREEGRCFIWGEVENNQGRIVNALLETPEAYQLTAHTALLAAVKMADTKIPTGFQTPSLAFGADFILEVAGTKRVEA